MTSPRDSDRGSGPGECTGVNLLLYNEFDPAHEEQLLTTALGLEHDLDDGIVVVDTHGNWERTSKYQELAKAEAVCLITTDDEQIPVSHPFHSVHVAADLTDIGIGMVSAFETLDGANVRVVFESVSDLIETTDEEAVFSFLQLITERVRVGGHFGLFTCDPSRHAPSTVATIESLFDDVVTQARVKSQERKQLNMLLKEANSGSEQR
ncbi:hypothetical protein G3I44_15025 [Halogeometricum borinquense]|uniref:Uncharacterized protein n=1 Tax=Halogeometricum borinquense TaxID=60847 RepID=A0A6C0UJ29_9EURY|nr:hypothetical protein [Halogeometricum borinquense]QIB75492.1 hypothetical protein G3I44_15025 [Halogeometricum borinquense]